MDARKKVSAASLTSEGGGASRLGRNSAIGRCLNRQAVSIILCRILLQVGCGYLTIDPMKV